MHVRSRRTPLPAHTITDLARHLFAFYVPTTPRIGEIALFIPSHSCRFTPYHFYLGQC